MNPPGPADHARDFSERYAPELDYHAAQTMIELGIPPEKIGEPDPEHGIHHAAFHPHGRRGGGITPDGRITIDSGVVDPELMFGAYGEEAGNLWAALRLRSRIEAIIAHEWTEHQTGSHEAALKAAPVTELPISHEASEMLRAMDRGWRR